MSNKNIQEQNTRFLLTRRIDNMQTELSTAKELINAGYKVTSPEIMEAIESVAVSAEDTVELLTTIDLEEKAEELAPVESFFKEDHINEFIDARVAFLQGDISAEEANRRMEAAANKIHNKTVTPETIADKVVATLEFGEDQKLAAEFLKQNLIKAIEKVQERSGRAESHFGVNGKSVSIVLTSTRDGVEIKLDGKVYFVPRQVEEEDYEDLPEVPKEVLEDDLGECTGDPETCTNPNCGGGEFDLHAVVEEFSDYISTEQNIAMNYIEELLANKKNYSDEDILVLRFYLKGLPRNSSYDIDELEDSTVVSAFKQRMYTLGKLD